MQALGIASISKGQVSWMCAELDTEVERFRTRRLRDSTAAGAGSSGTNHTAMVPESPI